jgi:hypothetical protein
MGVSMLLMVRLANKSRFAFATYICAYAGVFIILMQIVNLRVYYGVPPRTLLSSKGIISALAQLRDTSGSDHPTETQLSALDRYHKLGLPYATYEEIAATKYLMLRRQVEPEYYIARVGIYTAAAMQRKLSDVGKSEYVLVPSNFASVWQNDPCLYYLSELREWFFYSGKIVCHKGTLDPLGEISRFLVTNYQPVEQVGSSTILRRVATTE